MQRLKDKDSIEPLYVSEHNMPQAYASFMSAALDQKNGRAFEPDDNDVKVIAAADGLCSLKLGTGPLEISGAQGGKTLKLAAHQNDEGQKFLTLSHCDRAARPSSYICKREFIPESKLEMHARKEKYCMRTRLRKADGSTPGQATLLVPTKIMARCHLSGSIAC